MLHKTTFLSLGCGESVRDSLTVQHLPRLLWPVHVPWPGRQEALTLLEVNSILLQGLQKMICLCALVRINKALQFGQSNLMTPLGKHLGHVHICTGVCSPIQLFFDSPFLGTCLQDNSALMVNYLGRDILVGSL